MFFGRERERAAVGGDLGARRTPGRGRARAPPASGSGSGGLVAGREPHQVVEGVDLRGRAATTRGSSG